MNKIQIIYKSSDFNEYGYIENFPERDFTIPEFAIDFDNHFLVHSYGFEYVERNTERIFNVKVFGTTIVVENLFKLKMQVKFNSKILGFVYSTISLPFQILTQSNWFSKVYLKTIYRLRNNFNHNLIEKFSIKFMLLILYFPVLINKALALIFIDCKRLLIPNSYTSKVVLLKYSDLAINKINELFIREYITLKSSRNQFPPFSSEDFNPFPKINPVTVNEKDYSRHAASNY